MESVSHALRFDTLTADAFPARECTQARNTPSHGEQSRPGTRQVAHVSCRHTEGSEGAAFLKLFPGGLSILPGGVASGLKAAADTSKPELHKFSGTRHFRACQVPTEGGSLTSSDGFALDMRGAGNTIIQWVGKDAGLQLKYKLCDYAAQLSEVNHGGAADVLHLAEGETEGAAAASFFSTLGVKDPAAFVPAAASAAPAAAAAEARAWAVTYDVGGTTLGFPLFASGDAPREHSADVIDKVRRLRPAVRRLLHHERPLSHVLGGTGCQVCAHTAPASSRSTHSRNRAAAERARSRRRPSTRATSSPCLSRSLRRC